MKALLTAGGRATRLRPITYTINKHLIPIANKPMLFYALEKIAETGITEVGVNINEGDKELPGALGDGSRWGMKIIYLEQTGGAQGLAHIIKNAKNKRFLNNEPFLMYLGDNIIVGSIKSMVEKFEREKLNCLLALARVRDPQRFGVPEIRDGRIVRVAEKPAQPMSPYAITGIYLYDQHALDAVEVITPSARGEYEITDVHQYYIDKGLKVGFEEATGWWKDTGKPEDLLEANQLLLNEMKNGENGSEPDPAAIIQGKVKIGEGTKIGPRVLVRGPAVIGKNCVIENSYIGPYTSIGNEVQIYNTEIEHSIVFDLVRINCGKRIVDSLIGLNATVTSTDDSLPRGHKLIVGDHAVVEI
ncbi:glucose-1-phosphate thymidylyltransferase [Candidatus Uhrbacteria bacterium]|nr:glucose-1-phosphate thymidylyltransferase [Candidatus Uhrbacteria bacterium]